MTLLAASGMIRWCSARSDSKHDNVKPKKRTDF